MPYPKKKKKNEKKWSLPTYSLLSLSSKASRYVPCAIAEPGWLPGWCRFLLATQIFEIFSCSKGFQRFTEVFHLHMANIGQLPALSRTSRLRTSTGAWSQGAKEVRRNPRRRARRWYRQGSNQSQPQRRNLRNHSAIFSCQLLASHQLTADQSYSAVLRLDIRASPTLKIRQLAIPKWFRSDSDVIANSHQVTVAPEPQ